MFGFKIIRMSVLFFLILPLLITAEIKMDGKVIFVTGKVVLLDLGLKDGVKRSMRGTFYKVEKQKGKTIHLAIGTFRIISVEQEGSIVMIWEKEAEGKIQAGVTEYRFDEWHTTPKPGTYNEKARIFLPEGRGPIFADGIKVKKPECYYKPLPVYPDLARRAKMHGTVILQVLWDIKGRIREAKAMSSPGKQFGFDAAAIEAVKKWRCTPAIIEGRKVEIYGTVTVNFVLGNDSQQM